jgi:hypothetical protein
VRSGGPAPPRSLDAVDRLLVSFDHGLDAAVRQIPHPPVHAFHTGLGLREEPEADALHTTVYQIPPRNDHQNP